MKVIIRIGLGIAAGLIIGFLLMSLISGMVGDEPDADEWYIPLILIGIPALGGFGAGLYCALMIDEDDEGVWSWLLSIFLPIFVALIAAVVAVIVFLIALAIYAVASMTVGDWMLAALVLGLIGGVGYVIIIIFNG